MVNVEDKISEFLRVISDPTRRKIFYLISQQELNPLKIAAKLNISRPAVEKHLKLLIKHDLAEKLVKGYPKPKYVYTTTVLGEEIYDKINHDILEYFSSQLAVISEKINDLERKFIFGTISSDEYKHQKGLLLSKQKQLEDLDITEAYITEAKRIMAEYEDEKKRNVKNK